MPMSVHHPIYLQGRQPQTFMSTKLKCPLRMRLLDMPEYPNAPVQNATGDTCQPLVASSGIMVPPHIRQRQDCMGMANTKDFAYSNVFRTMLKTCYTGTTTRR